MKPTIEQIENFLKKVDFDFPVPLSQKTDLHTYAIKLYEKPHSAVRTTRMSSTL